MLARIGARFDELLSHRVFDLVATMPLKGAKQAESMQPIRDLDTIRGFLSSLGPTALFDMPFMPIFLIGCFMIHPGIGVMSVVGGVVIIVLTLYTDAKSKGPVLRGDQERRRAPRHGRDQPPQCGGDPRQRHAGLPGQALRRGACPSRQ